MSARNDEPCDHPNCQKARNELARLRARQLHDEGWGMDVIAQTLRIPRSEASRVVRVLREKDLACARCGRPYWLGPDLVIPDEAWRRISPNGDDGGVLCPNCINDRLEEEGFVYASVPAAFTSGPMANPDWVKP